MQTKSNIYQPSGTEQKLIEILINPEYYGKSVKDICLAAGVGRNSYYEAFKRPAFVEFYNGLMQDMVKGKVGDIVRATVKYAVECPQNHQDRRMLLEMGGLYTPKEKREITGKDEGAITVRLEGDLKEWAK